MSWHDNVSKLNNFHFKLVFVEVLCSIVLQMWPLTNYVELWTMTKKSVLLMKIQGPAM